MQPKTPLYPLKFTPWLKETLWGGAGIAQFKGLPDFSQNIGESWEIAQVNKHISTVANGTLQGKNLSELLRIYQSDLVGNCIWEKFGEKFPLLIKWIDAQKDLSIQVHPDDAMAARYGSLGKAEMWYVIKSAPGSTLLAGLNEGVTPNMLNQAIHTASYENLIQRYDIHPGDLFYLPAGCIHAIGKGAFLLEIQQSSDISFRLYDYDRKDASGNLRELHVAEAKEAVLYHENRGCHIHYNAEQEGISLLMHAPSFSTYRITLSQPALHTLNSEESFTIYSCIQGEALLSGCGFEAISIQQGETLLIPAIIDSVQITPKKSVEIISCIAH